MSNWLVTIRIIAAITVSGRDSVAYAASPKSRTKAFPTRAKTLAMCSRSVSSKELIRGTERAALTRPGVFYSMGVLVRPSNVTLMTVLVVAVPISTRAASND